jgi:tetratricopeptide (TPR) repeat protein
LNLDPYRQDLWFITVPPMLSLDPWFGAGANMFDQLSLRYRGTGFTAKPIHAHNDWLQLLAEYGRIGLALGAAFFVVHVAAGWRNALKMARDTPLLGLLPQSTTLGLAAGCVGAAVSVGVHAFFDYGMHIPAFVLLAGLCGGWLAGARTADDAREPGAVSWWMKLFALMPLVAGLAFGITLLREAPAEYRALLSENALCSGDAGASWDEAMSGLALRPTNPRLLLLAGESAGQLGDSVSSPEEKEEWYSRASAYFDEAIRERPLFAYTWRERALSLAYQGRFREALPVHLRAIARDPDHARGYEYLAYYYWRQGDIAEARRLFRLAQTLTGSFLAGDCLRLLDTDRDSL